MLQIPRWNAAGFVQYVTTPGAVDAMVWARCGNSSTTMQALYGRFIDGPNFTSWFQERRKPVEHLVEPEPPVSPNRMMMLQLPAGLAVLLLEAKLL